MKKIISVFKRDFEGDGIAVNEVTPGAEWVLAGEGVATRKYDGSCCLIREGKFYKRYDAKKGKTPPQGFIPAQDEADPVTGHWPGWLLVGDEPEDKWFRDALKHSHITEDGTYEAVGTCFQGNPEQLYLNCLIKHGDHKVDCPRDFDAIREFLSRENIEGVVFHHPDGRMAKVKKKDFGIKR